MCTSLMQRRLRMPRRKSATSITAAIGKRINLIREQRGFTLARVGVPDEDDRGNLKGHLSNIEHGRVAPTVFDAAKDRGQAWRRPALSRHGPRGKQASGAYRTHALYERRGSRRTAKK